MSDLLTKEVLEQSDPALKKREKMESFGEEKSRVFESLKRKNIAEHPYLNDPANLTFSRKKNTMAYLAADEEVPVGGHSIFDPRNGFKAFEKRSAKLPMNEEAYELQKKGQGPSDDNPERVDLLIKELGKQRESRENFHRRRTVDPDARAIHVSEKNRQFNERLQRHFGKQVSELAARDTKPTI